MLARQDAISSRLFFFYIDVLYLVQNLSICWWNPGLWTCIRHGSYEYYV